MDTNEFDLIVLLEKREYPKCIENKALPARDDEYVCLGHFDYARIALVESGVREKEFRSFRNHREMENLYKEAEDPEGLQRNYLVAYNTKRVSSCVNPLSVFSFIFMMKISVDNNNKSSLEKYAERFEDELSNTGKEDEFLAKVYFPISKGDLIIMLYANNFSLATRLLSDFACKQDIRYSYTIPMVKATWLKNPPPKASEPDELLCSMRLRATVRDYNRLDNFIRGLFDQSLRQSPFVGVTVEKRASYGTDDIEYNLGMFSEEKLHHYLTCVIEKQKLFRSSVFSAEMDISRRIPFEL